MHERETSQRGDLFRQYTHLTHHCLFLLFSQGFFFFSMTVVSLMLPCDFFDVASFFFFIFIHNKVCDLSACLLCKLNILSLRQAWTPRALNVCLCVCEVVVCRCVLNNISRDWCLSLAHAKLHKSNSQLKAPTPSWGKQSNWIATVTSVL